MKIFDSASSPASVGKFKVGKSGDHMLSVNSDAALGGGTLTLALTDSAGETLLTDELTFTSAPPATVVSLAAGWTVTASLDGATGADLQVYLSEM